MDPTGSELDEEQHVERLKEGGLDREEVTGQDPLCLRPQELGPGGPVSSGSWPEAVSPEKRADGRRAHPDAETVEFALDPHAPPARVLPRQAKNQLVHLRGHRRAPEGLPSEGPSASDQFPVPAKERCR